MYTYVYTSGRVLWGSLAAPNEADNNNLTAAQSELALLQQDFKNIKAAFVAAEGKVRSAGAPWFPGLGE